MARLLVSVALAFVFLAGCEGSGVPLYQSCTGAADCNATADDCFTVAWQVGRVGTMCSLYCTEHSDCPGNSSCYELVGDPTMRMVCFSRCDSNLDCPSDYECVDAEMGGGVIDSICLPS